MSRGLFQRWALLSSMCCMSCVIVIWNSSLLDLLFCDIVDGYQILSYLIISFPIFNDVLEANGIGTSVIRSR